MKKIILSSLFAAFLVFAAFAGGASASTVWHVDVTASYGYDSNRVIVGAAYDATDGFENNYDGRAIMAGSLLAYFNRPEWAVDAQYFWSDIKDASLPKEWTFYVSSSYVNKTITLKWALNTVPDTLNLSLVDDTAGATVDMKALSTYTYTNTSNAPRSFRVLASGSVPPAPPPPDTTPPDTSITSMAGNARLTVSSVTIDYTGSDDTSAATALQYSYAIDSGAWSAWSSSTSASMTTLTDGAHTFSVKAMDEAGNEDPTPAIVNFTVDTLTPVLTITSVSDVFVRGHDGVAKTTITGSATSASSPIASVTYKVRDAYGETVKKGGIELQANGDFILDLRFPTAIRRKTAEREKDHHAKRFVVEIKAVNNAGRAATRSVDVIVR